MCLEVMEATQHAVNMMHGRSITLISTIFFDGYVRWREEMGLDERHLSSVGCSSTFLGADEHYSYSYELSEVQLRIFSTLGIWSG